VKVVFVPPRNLTTSSSQINLDKEKTDTKCIEEQKNKENKNEGDINEGDKKQKLVCTS
jgi:hypothetical protein